MPRVRFFFLAQIILKLIERSCMLNRVKKVFTCVSQVEMIRIASSLEIVCTLQTKELNDFSPKSFRVFNAA